MAEKCPKHPNYSGIRRPKKTAAMPEGCKECWTYYGEKNHEDAEAARPVRKRSQQAIDSQLRLTSQEYKTGNLKVEVDADTGDLALMNGKRCIYVCTSENELHAFMAGLREGRNRGIGKSFVGEE